MLIQVLPNVNICVIRRQKP